VTTLPHILQTEKQLAERYGLKPKKLSYWRRKKRTRYHKDVKSVLYWLDEFAEDLKDILKEPETMTL
jgi:hypothetical protein